MGRAKGYSRNCRGCSIDCLPNILLQDADLYYHSRIKAKSDLIHVFGGQGCIRTFRSIWVAVPLLLLAFWIAYNAWAATLSDDHLRGSLADVWAESSVLRLRSFQSATTVKPASRAPHFLRRASARGIFCACTFTGGINALEPPYTVFENNPNFKGVYPGKVSDLDLINMCPHPCPLELNPETTPPHVLEALVDALTLFTRTVRDARISVPPTTVMLENGSTWHAAQLSVAHNSIVAGQNRAKESLAFAELKPASNQTKLSPRDVEGAACHVDRLYAALLIQASILFNLPPAEKHIEVYNATSQQMEIMRCDRMPSHASELPWRLKHYCPKVASAQGAAAAAAASGGVNLTQGLSTVNCTDPYLAYQQWCRPQYCIQMQEKGVWERATESLAALGGLWSLITAVLFTFAWPAIYASYKNYRRWQEMRSVSKLAAAAAGPQGNGTGCVPCPGKPDVQVP